MGRAVIRLSGVCIFILSALAGAKNIYINGANTGAQDGNGIATGYKTIQQAAAVAVAGDMVLVGAGTYCETVKPANSGASGSPITFKNNGSDVVTICGGDKITGAWTLDANSIYWAPCNWTMGQYRDQVVADGDLMIEARYPNIAGKDELVGCKVAGKLFAATVYSDHVESSSLTQGADFFKGGLFWGSIGNKWACQTAPITGSSTGNLAIGNPRTTGWDWWQVGGDGGGVGSGCVIGVKNALDADREWYLDTTAGRLYFRAPGGVNPSGMTVYVKKRNTVFDISSRSYIVIDGINTMMGSINASSATGCQLRNGKYFYGNYYSFCTAGSGASLGVLPTGAPPAVQVSGDNNLIYGCEIAYTSHLAVSLKGTNGIMINSYVHDAGYAGLYASGIEMPDNRVERCTIARIGRAAVPVAARATLTHCDISDYSMLTEDNGAIYTDGTDGGGATFSYNWIHGERGVYCRNNGIYWDNVTSNYIGHHNVFWDVKFGYGMNDPSDNHQCYNNTIWSNPGCENGEVWYNGGSGCKIYNNIGNESPFVAGSGADEQKNLILGNSGFVGTGHGGLRFRLKSTSPAVNAGMVIPGFTNGYTGSAPDVGAYEYGGPDSLSNWTAGAWSVDGDTSTHIDPNDTSSAPRNPDNPQGAVQGISYKYYQGAWSLIPDYSTMTPVKSGTCANFDITLATQADNFGLRFEGFVSVPSEGVYVFSTTSDDGSKLYIGNKLIVNNDGSHGMISAGGDIALKAGMHAIHVDFFQGNGGKGLTVTMNGQAIAAGSLFRADGATVLRGANGCSPAARTAAAVYNIRGQRTAVLTDEQLVRKTCDLSSLSTGMHFVTVVRGGATIAKTFLIVK